MQVKVLEWANYPELKTLDDYFDLIESYLAANPVDVGLVAFEPAALF